MTQLNRRGRLGICGTKSTAVRSVKSLAKRLRGIDRASESVCMTLDNAEKALHSAVGTTIRHFLVAERSETRRVDAAQAHTDVLLGEKPTPQQLALTAQVRQLRR